MLLMHLEAFYYENSQYKFEVRCNGSRLQPYMIYSSDS